MKKYLSICLLAAALVLPAHAGLGYGGGVVIPGGGGSSAGAVTNGLTDATAIAFCVSNSIADPQAALRVQRFCQRAKAMTAWPWLARQFLLNRTYNPTNHLDLFGNPATFVNEQYDAIGFKSYWTNYLTFSFPAMTNWTVILFRQGYPDTALPPVLSGNLNALSECDRLEWSMENNDSSITASAFSSPRGQVVMETSNSITSLPFQTNINNSGFVNAVGMANSQFPFQQTFPTVSVFERDSANGNVYGWQDATKCFALNSATKTNLNVAQSGGTSTNLNPASVFYLNGGSTNFWQMYPVTQGSPSNGGSGNRWFTNGVFSTFAVAVFSTNLSPADINIYYTAVNELWPSRDCTVFHGTSMMAEFSNRFWFSSFWSQVWSNSIPYFYAARFPNVLVKNYSQGGASLVTMQNVTYAGGATGVFPTNGVALLPPDFNVTLVTDHPRNDATAVTTNGYNFDLVSSNFANAYLPYATMPQVKSVTAFESVLWATNSATATATNLITRTNFVTATLNLQTNMTVHALISRYVHAQAYWGGKYWTTNPATGFYAWDSSGGGGFHIESTNQNNEIYYFSRMAALIPVGGEWPETMATATQISQ
jgi:hypothetical protein